MFPLLVLLLSSFVFSLPMAVIPQTEMAAQIKKLNAKNQIQQPAPKKSRFTSLSVRFSWIQQSSGLYTLAPNPYGINLNVSRSRYAAMMAGKVKGRAFQLNAVHKSQGEWVITGAGTNLRMKKTASGYFLTGRVSDANGMKMISWHLLQDGRKFHWIGDGAQLRIQGAPRSIEIRGVLDLFRSSRQELALLNFCAVLLY